MKYRRILLSAFLFGLSFAYGCRKASLIPARTTVKQKYRENVRKVIEASGENAAELRRFLLHYQNDKKRLEAASFLIANMPLCDAASMSAEALSEHIDYAFKARSEMPWGENIPWSTFLHFVVTHRASGEPAQRYRKLFYDEIAPLVRNCRTMAEAALKVNEWCFLKAVYKPSSWRDQGPLSTVKRGWGRCEEEMILYISAARSVCIPARQCYTPRWQFSNSNHAWVEVWADGNWSYLGACEPKVVLNSAWFSAPAKLAVFVISTVYGEMDKTDELIYRKGKGCTFINSTPVYTKPCVLKVKVLDKDGAPLAKAKVFVSIFNYNIFYPSFSITTDEKGEGSLIVGRGTMLLSVAKDGNKDCQLAQVVPDRDTLVTLDMRENRTLSGEYWIRFGSGPKAVDGDEAISDETKKRLRDRMKMFAKARAAEFKGYKCAIASFLGINYDEKLEDAKDKTEEIARYKKEWESPLAKALLTSGANCFELIRALSASPPEQYETMVKYISTMEDKDLLECNAADILADVDFALKARYAAEESGFCSYEDEVFYEYVLANRIYREPYSCWRPFVSERVSGFRDGDLNFAARSINEYVKLLRDVDPGSFGGILTPVEIAKSGAVERDCERSIAAVAMFRALGIPARYKNDWDWVEFFDGSEWLPLYPKEPDRLGSRNAKEGDEKESAYAKPATVEIQLLLDGKPINKAWQRFYLHFSISTFTNDGYFSWASFEEPVFDAGKKCHVVKLSPGDYYLTTGKRNSINEPFVHILPFTCKEGETVKLQLETGIPEDGSLPIVRNPGSFVNIEGVTLTGKKFSLSESLKTGRKIILTFFDPFSEPCVGMMPQLMQFLNREDVEIIGIGTGGSADDFRSFVSKHCRGLEVIHDADGELAKKYKTGEMPSILVLAPDGRIIMWYEGHNLQIGELLEKALK